MLICLKSCNNYVLLCISRILRPYQMISRAILIDTRVNLGELKSTSDLCKIVKIRKVNIFEKAIIIMSYCGYSQFCVHIKRFSGLYNP